MQLVEHLRWYTKIDVLERVDFNKNDFLHIDVYIYTISHAHTRYPIIAYVRACNSLYISRY